MSASMQTMRNEKLNAIEAGFRAEGCVVLREPTSDQLPFDLHGYLPDLVASKDELGWIVEVQAQQGRLSVERRAELSEEISEHRGWRYILVTFDDVDAWSIPAHLDDLLTWQQIDEKFGYAQDLVAAGATEAGFLYLWSLFEAGLRRQAIFDHIPVERFPSQGLLVHTYTLGEISIDYFKLLKQCLATRNRIAHGSNETVSMDLIENLIAAFRYHIEEWASRRPEEFDAVSDLTCI